MTPDTVVKIEPAESKSYWVERRGTKSGVRLTYDEPVSGFMGNLCVQATWHEIIYRDEMGWEDENLIF